MKRMKSFFKNSGRRRKGSLPTASPPHEEIRLGPAQLLDERRTQEPELGTYQLPDQPSHAQASDPSRHASNKHINRSPTVQQSISGNGDHTVDASDHAPQPPGAQEENDSIADNYRAYMDAISPGSKSSTDAEFFSLGSDSRLRTGNSKMKHNEDIANRNIEYSGVGYSCHDSPNGQNADNQAAQDHEVRRKHNASSFASSESRSVGGGITTTGSSSLLQPKYSLGSGIATEGGLVDGILPHVEDPHARPFKRKDWPTRLPRNDLSPSTQTRLENADDSSINEKTTQKKSDHVMGLREAVMGGPVEFGLKADLDGVVDLRDTEDVEKETRWAPAVTHEVVKPHEHEIIEERIYREIHNHEVYHYIQPVYETEILPARHWVYNANNELVEVMANQLPECTGANQRWSIARGDREKPASHIVRSSSQAREPRIISDKSYITPEGFERRETTILHPPELEDMSNYSGPVVPIEFLHHPEHAPKRELKAVGKPGNFPNGRHLTMEELSDALPVVRTGSSSSSSQFTDSSTSSSAPKRLSIPRKPVPTLPSY